jgi:hypothetical protein
MQAMPSVSGTATFSLSNVVLGDTSDVPQDLHPAIVNGAIVVGNPAPPPVTPGGWAALTDLPPANFNSVWSNSGADAFIAGDNGNILHYNGTIWNTSQSGVTDTLEDVWAKSASEAYAVGLRSDNYGTILKYDGTNWVPQISGVPYRFYGVWGSGNEVFAVGHNGWNGVVMHFDGTSRPFGASQPIMHTLWAAPALSFILTAPPGVR